MERCRAMGGCHPTVMKPEYVCSSERIGGHDMRAVLAATALIAVLLAASAASAQAVYPIDRADILTGSRFDFKVEFGGLVDPAKVAVTLNGKDYAQIFGKTATFIEREDGK